MSLDHTKTTLSKKELESAVDDLMRAGLDKKNIEDKTISAYTLSCLFGYTFRECLIDLCIKPKHSFRKYGMKSFKDIEDYADNNTDIIEHLKGTAFVASARMRDFIDQITEEKPYKQIIDLIERILKVLNKKLY